eukprot:1616628-Prymnesium_polylepis.1
MPYNISVWFLRFYCGRNVQGCCYTRARNRSEHIHILLSGNNLNGSLANSSVTAHSASVHSAGDSSPATPPHTQQEKGDGATGGSGLRSSAYRFRSHTRLAVPCVHFTATRIGRRFPPIDCQMSHLIAAALHTCDIRTPHSAESRRTCRNSSSRPTTSSGPSPTRALRATRPTQAGWIT